MAHPVIMPRQGQSVESCILAEWHKKPGDKISAGEVLFSYETDKAGFDEEAPVDGTLLAVFWEAGDDVPCLANVCVIGSEGEDVSAFDPHAGSAAPAAAQEAQNTQESAPAAQESAAAPVTASAGSSAFASPRAKAAAERMGVDYSQAAATGPNGRVIERDVVALRGAQAGFASRGAQAETAQAAPAAAPAAAAVAAPAGTEPMYDEAKVPNIRRVIAKAMRHSLESTSQLTMNASFDATAILAYRARVKQNREKLGLENITLGDLVLYAVSRTLLDHKDLNATFDGETMRHFRHVNLGVAVDTPRGLMVPTVFEADRKSLNEISAEVKSLAAACQSGSINPDMLKNGSFTVTNLGSFGVETFTPILNPPQTGILGVGTLTDRVCRGKNGEVTIYSAMNLSLTIDHGAVDGAPGARFLAQLASSLENFDILLAK